jgi:hypothetical protein
MQSDTETGTYSDLFEAYGPVLTVDELARVLKYPSASAVRQAHAAGNLPVRLGRFPGRRTLLARTREVADAIEQRLALERNGEEMIVVK